MRAELLKVVVGNAGPVHAATVAGTAWLHLPEGAVEAEHFVTLLFRPP